MILERRFEKCERELDYRKKRLQKGYIYRGRMFPGLKVTS